MRQILVIGGGGGLGTALVNQCFDRSFQVVVAGRSRPSDSRVQRFYPVDATNADWNSLYGLIEEETGHPLDAIIFVAGTAVFGKTELIPLDIARKTLELNFWACTTAARGAAELWTANGRKGKFLAILSIAARCAVPFESYYCASRAATARFLECLQIEYAHKGLEFMAAFPGLLRTPFRRNAEWYGFNPGGMDEGADVQKTAETIVRLLLGKRKTRVIGWRERTIDLAGRFFPGLYERTVLRFRVEKLLKSGA